jgi:U32 family peptidase
LYLTVNTLLKTRELEQELYDYLLPCYEHGLDAVLVQDMGVLKAVREWFPDLPVHASTQMTLNGVGGVKVLKELGAERAVLSRELSLNEIAVISRETGMELETFVHGALCYCYSGQCLFSSILGGRSGNRGRCAQPCRLAYSAVDEKGKNLTEEQTLLSPKDICALDLIPEIAKAGVYSLKIEGRMKRPEYTAGVARIYRKYVDQYLQYGEENYKVAEADRRELLLLFNRDGFSEGYYRQHNGKNMMALKNAEASEQEKRAYEELIARIHKEYVETEQKVRINGCLSACEGKPMSLVLTAEKHPEISVRVEGEVPQKAQNRPMEEAQFAKQLRKTGNTSFEWEHLEIHLEGNLFVPVGALNNLRREALEAIRKALLESFFRPIPVELPEEGKTTIKEKAWKKTVLHVSVETEEQLESILSYVQEDGKESGMEAVYLEAETLEDHLEQDIRQIHAEGMKAYVMLPVVFREKTRERYEKRLNFWKELDTDGYVIRNLEEYTFLKENDLLKGMITDHNVYTFNKQRKQSQLHCVKCDQAFALRIQIKHQISQKMHPEKQDILLPQSRFFLFFGFTRHAESQQRIDCQKKNQCIFCQTRNYIYHCYSTPRLKCPLVNSPFSGCPFRQLQRILDVSLPFSVVNISRYAPACSASSSSFRSRR